MHAVSSLLLIAPFLVCCAAPQAAAPAAPLLALASANVPVLDERAWLDQLLAHRPELVMQHEGTIKDPAWQALVLKPRFRDELLSNPSATWETIVAREYTPALRAADAAWATSLQTAEAALDPSGAVRAGRQADTYAWFDIVEGAASDPAGLDYKVFLDFVNFDQSLTPARVVAFTAALDQRGFVGDFKIDLRPGITRFDYNQIIFHATTAAMGLCAEAVGLAFFNAELAHVARGIDVMRDKKGYDWHHFLLTDTFDQLPAEAKDYVGYRTVVPDKVCPKG